VNNNCTEIVVHKEGLFNKVKLGFKYIGNKFNNDLNKLESIYVKYNEVSKRHIY
jgi:hypothetical protein